MRSKSTILIEGIGCARWSLHESVGLVTTLVFIMAVSEVAPARLLLVVLGEVLAGGISMALGGYLSARTAGQILDQHIATERYEIEHEPDEERVELVAIYRNKGFSDPLLDRVGGI
jgi:VIT1/CCC1 family predicted Fe2+/Mn2+ transporter